MGLMNAHEKIMEKFRELCKEPEQTYIAANNESPLLVSKTSETYLATISNDVLDR